MIAQSDLDQFALVASEAFSSAEGGRVVHGYLLLRSGLDAAHLAPVLRRASLVALWEQGLRSFRRRFPTEWYSDEILNREPALHGATSDLTTTVGRPRGGTLEL